MIIYLLAVSGVMINLHYCGQTLENWSMYVSSNGCDEGECGIEEDEPDDCCENKTISSKLSEDQNLATLSKLKINAVDWAILPKATISPVFKSSFSSVEINIDNQPNAPPGLWENIPLYKLHTSLTYYG